MKPYALIPDGNENQERGVPMGGSYAWMISALSAY